MQALYGVPPERIRVIHNGIDLRQYRPTPDPGVLARVRHRSDDRRIVLFVGRITRQKGIIHLVNAIKSPPRRRAGGALRRGARHAGDRARRWPTPSSGRAPRPRSPIIWIPEMLSKEQVIALYTHAAIFVCPSVYEPFGIINLEAMACETPVVASAVGGIPEVVEHGETGLLVASEAIGATEVEPRHPEQFARDLAAAVNALLDDPGARATMARKAQAARRGALQLDQHRAPDAGVLRGAKGEAKLKAKAYLIAATRAIRGVAVAVSLGRGLATQAPLAALSL